MRLSPPSLMRSHEAVSNLRNFLDVKLAYNRCDENAMQQDFERHAEIVGPLLQECPISRLFRLKVVGCQFYDGVRRLAVSARVSMVLHGRFLFLNGIGVGCVRVGECISTCQPALFGGCGHYRDRSLGCQGNYCDKASFCGVIYLRRKMMPYRNNFLDNRNSCL